MRIGGLGNIVGSARSIGLFLQDQLHDHSLLFTKETRNLFSIASRIREAIEKHLDYKNNSKKEGYHGNRTVHNKKGRS